VKTPQIFPAVLGVVNADATGFFHFEKFDFWVAGFNPQPFALC
jgi:hypothetical protein